MAASLQQPRPLEILRALKIDEIASCTDEELSMIQQYEAKGDEARGRLPFRVALDRERALESPSYYATEIVDPYYKRNFERIHYEFMDEVAAPYLLGQEFKLDGALVDPNDYVGFVISFSRDTLKSSMARLLADWLFKYTKIRLGYDTRLAYIHQVLAKAIKAGEAMRATARSNKKCRRTFPEFQGPQGEWDTKQEWRWPSFTSHQSTEYSFTAYGETSDKTGGHYTARFVDDWENESSVGTQEMIEKSIHNFDAMDPLRDRTRPFCPLLVVGTPYHHQALMKTLELNNGYLYWKVPAHKGSPKVIFDLAGLDPRKDKRKIEAGLKVLETTRADDLNFPQRLPWRELLKSARGQSATLGTNRANAGGAHIYNCQMLLNPTPEGESRFDLEALESGWVDEIPQPWEMHIYIRCDPAISEKKDADECAILVGGVHWDASRWLVDGWMGREKQPNKIVLKAFDYAVKWKKLGYSVVSIGFEAVAYQAALIGMSRYGVGERAAVADGESVPMRTKPCPVVGIERPPDRTKAERIMSMDGPVTRREVKFWRKCSIADKVMNQFKNFPYDRDDGLDAMHDFWIKTRTPSPPMVDVIPNIPREFQKMLREEEFTGRPQLTGTNNTIPLAGGWN